MFESKRQVQGAETANGRPTGVSASDQKIVFRRFGSPIEVEIGGEKIMLKPAVFDASDVIHRIVNDARSGVLAESITEQIDAVMKSANIKNKFDAQMLLGAQFIIYNAKFPDWVDRLDGIPPADELEKAITIKKLRKKCTNEDINGLFEVFYQLNQPEVMRQNFLKLGTIL